MSFQEKFLSNPWAFVVVSGIILAIIVAITVGLLCNCFWEITKPRILNLLYRICPCLSRVAHPHLSSTDRRIIALERGQARYLTDIATSREAVLEGIRVLNERLDAISQLDLSNIQIHRQPVGVSSSSLAGDSASSGAESSNSTVPMEENRSVVVGESSSSGAQPSNSTVLACVTLFLPSITPFIVWTWAVDFLRRRARGGSWLCWRSSIVIQAVLSIDSYVLAEIGELVKKCCSVENGFTLQIASWGIFYHNGEDLLNIDRLLKIDSVHLLMLKEGDVPVVTEAKWNKKRIGITMHGLYLNGAQIKATTKRTHSITLRSGGPPLKGRGNLDELHFPIEGIKGFEDSLIHAAKVVEFDGISLVVRSEASTIVPPKSSLTELLQDGLQKILPLAMKMTQSVLESIPDVKLLVDYWIGVSQMEMIDCRKRIIIQLQNLPAPDVSAFDSEQFLRVITLYPSSRDKEYWQRALHDLQDLSEDYLSNGSNSQSSTFHSTGGRIKFLLGEFESALLDFDYALNSTTEGLASILLDRAVVKSVLARYAEATQDIRRGAEINPNSYDFKRFQACLEDILYMDPSKFWRTILQPKQPEFDLMAEDHDLYRYYEKKRVIERSWMPKLIEMREPSKDLPKLNLEQETSHNQDFPQLLRDYLNLYGMAVYDSLRIDEELALGDGTIVIEARGAKTNLVLKVFNLDFTLLESLQPGVFQFGGDYLDHPSPFLCTALGVTFLNDGRCAFVYPRHWGDLRRLIDQQRKTSYPFKFPSLVKIMLQIAEGMRSLHIRNILHRNLKAANILVSGDNPAREGFRCMVADFEFSVGVVGTGFWRAPEILYELKHRRSYSEALAGSKEADVYSFGMTCYEILTGSKPFEDLRLVEYDVVTSGGRPPLPSSLDPKLITLIELCWHADPERRPSFSMICGVLAGVLADVTGN